MKNFWITLLIVASGSAWAFNVNQMGMPQQGMAVNPGGMVMMPGMPMTGAAAMGSELPAYQTIPGAGAAADCQRHRFDKSNDFDFSEGAPGGGYRGHRNI